MTILFLKMHQGLTNLHNQFQPYLIKNKGIRAIFCDFMFFLKKNPKFEKFLNMYNEASKKNV